MSLIGKSAVNGGFRKLTEEIVNERQIPFTLKSLAKRIKRNGIFSA